MPGGHARYLLFTGESIDAAEAERIGLVNRKLSHDDHREALEVFFARRLYPRHTHEKAQNTATNGHSGLANAWLLLTI